MKAACPEYHSACPLGTRAIRWSAPFSLLHQTWGHLCPFLRRNSSDNFSLVLQVLVFWTFFSPFPVTHWVQSVFHNIPYSKPVRRATTFRSVYKPDRLLAHLLFDFFRLKTFGWPLGPTLWVPDWFPQGKAARREAHHAQSLVLTLGMSPALIPVLFYTTLAQTGMIFPFGPLRPMCLYHNIDALSRNHCCSG